MTTTANTTKAWYLSKTLFVNLAVLAAVLFPAVREFLAGNPETVVAAVAAVNVLLRFATKGRVSLSGGGGTGGALPSLALLAAAGFSLAGLGLLSSCGISITEDGCILGNYTKAGHTYQAGPCVGPDADGDGNADIDRVRVQWRNEAGQALRATYRVKPPKTTLIEYQLQPGLWVGWSSKSGVVIGPLPPEVEQALRGNPQPIDPPPSLPPISTGEHQGGGEGEELEPVTVLRRAEAREEYAAVRNQPDALTLGAL